jgi:hypothetical protein
MAERYTHFEDGGRIDGRLSSPTPPRAPAAETAGTNPSAEALAERDEFGASVVILADDLNEARAELEVARAALPAPTLPKESGDA